MQKLWRGHINETIHSMDFIAEMENYSDAHGSIHTKGSETKFKHRYHATVPVHYKVKEGDLWQKAHLFIDAHSLESLNFEKSQDPIHNKGLYQKTLRGIGLPEQGTPNDLINFENTEYFLSEVEIVVIPYIEGGTIKFDKGMSTCCKKLVLNGSFNTLAIKVEGSPDIYLFEELWIYGDILSVLPFPYPLERLRVPPETQNIRTINSTEIIGLNKMIREHEMNVEMEDRPTISRWQTIESIGVR